MTEGQLLVAIAQTLQYHTQLLECLLRQQNIQDQAIAGQVASLKASSANLQAAINAAQSQPQP